MSIDSQPMADKSINNSELECTEVIPDEVIPCNQKCEDLSNREEFC